MTPYSVFYKTNLEQYKMIYFYQLIGVLLSLSFDKLTLKDMVIVYSKISIDTYLIKIAPIPFF